MHVCTYTHLYTIVNDGLSALELATTPGWACDIHERSSLTSRFLLYSVKRTSQMMDINILYILQRLCSVLKEKCPNFEFISYMFRASHLSF